MGQVCSFFGHRFLDEYAEQIKPKLREVIVNLVHKGVDTFYVGSYGGFDVLSSLVLSELKETYPQIQVILILAYANEINYTQSYFQDFFLPPDVEATPKRACIVKRNQWVVRNSDVVIGCVKYPMGGAYNAVQYAQKKKKRIIEIQI